MKLSILIPTIPERQNMYGILFKKLKDQVRFCNDTHPSLGKIEILFDDREKFTISGLTVGAKRNALLKAARGEYLCFLDDDDDIAPNYAETLLRFCQGDKDIYTFNSLFVCDTYWSLIRMSLSNIENEQATPEKIVQRKPWHICPVRSEIAKNYKFPDINNAEDWGWMEQVLKMCNTEERTEKIIHSYRHSSKVSAVDAI